MKLIDLLSVGTTHTWLNVKYDGKIYKGMAKYKNVVTANIEYDNDFKALGDNIVKEIYVNKRYELVVVLGEEDGDKK